MQIPSAAGLSHYSGRRALDRAYETPHPHLVTTRPLEANAREQRRHRAASCGHVVLRSHVARVT